ncbi:ABC transporter permease [Puerhibacterium sp. TATVAM-FAB25]|uniref:ABC transporter permease n=1 Tax=Puerhibacterium sp. TATVAM-FAB25 TaxID=3093699 RepID=UPI00397878B6
MTGPATAVRPTPAALAGGQVRHAATEYWRARVVLVFSLLVPLVWLVMIGALAGNEVVDPVTGLRVMQFATPIAVTMGTLYGTLPTVAITLVQARETGVLRHLRGTPLPTWAYLLGRVVAASAFALLAVGAAVGLALVAYDVQVVWRTVPATVVTLLAGVLCFVTLGLGLATVCRSTTVAQGVSIGGVVVLSFVSGLFTFGTPLPEPVTRVADVLPVKPLTEALQDQFNPHLSGAGWDLRALGILLAWTAVGAVIAAAGLRDREATASGGPSRSAAAEVASRDPERADRVVTAPAVQAGPRPRPDVLVRGQVGAAVRATWRDPGAVFFAVVLPVGLYALIASTADAGPVPSGAPFRLHLAAGMITWGVAVTSFLNIPEAVVTARDRGVLKRLRGTPLLPAHYLAGRVVAGTLLALAIAAVVLALGAAAFGARPSPAGLGASAAVLMLGSVTLTACGFLLAAVVRNARTFGAVGLVALLPVAFVSDVFVTGAPAWMSTVGSFFPLKHLQNALTELLAGVGGADTWWHVAVLAAWALGAGALALRFFRWQSPDP